jgi:hypothetical protein
MGMGMGWRGGLGWVVVVGRGMHGLRVLLLGVRRGLVEGRGRG